MNKNISKNKEEEIKYEALTDNTAQGIFNYLEEIENKPEIYNKRWIWELLQNALDSALPDRRIEIEIIKKDNRLIFIHNGRPFKREEVAHLIYHGSTKKEQDIGKFGTGFLITHLLSRKVNVKGVREDGKKFKFVLDREGVSADEIKNRMEATWTRYQNSLGVIEEDLHSTAEYEYPLSNMSLNTVEAGIKELVKIAPYVLVFNDKLRTIKIAHEAYSTKFELINESNETAYIHKVVKEETDGKPEILHELWVMKDNEVEIAVKGKRQGDETYQIESLYGIPKIFLAFPLFGTQGLPFPVVVNSIKFNPTEKREGIFLGKEDTDNIKRNKRLLEKASELFTKLVFDSSPDRWKNIHTLLNIDILPDKDWLDKEWYTNLLRELIGKIINAKVLKIENGGYIPIREGFVPIIDSLEKDLEKIEKLWDLCYSFLTYRDKIPSKELTIDWIKIINGWKSLGLNLTERELTIEKLAEDIEKCEDLQCFENRLGSGDAGLGTLNGFYNLLLETKKQWLFDSRNILPNQNGNFKKKQELFKDEEIDEILKDVSNKLGRDIRNLLLHSKISEDVRNLLPPKSQDEVLNQIVSIIRQPRPEDNQYLQANIELFNWLLEHDRFEYFEEGYPLLSSKENIFAPLGKERERLLAPKEIWNEMARIYADLFPQEFIISSLYYGKTPQQDRWNKLKDEGLILTDPLYEEKEKISGDDLDSFLLPSEQLEEEKDHDVEDEEVSKIAFFETKDKGIIDSVRKSKEKARKFLGFLFDYVIENDARWEEPIEVNCSCGTKHRIYRGFWMARLKSRSWIPVRKGKSEKPNVQYLALLLEGHNELLQHCRQDKPSRLLSILNVSISGLMMHIVAKDDKIKLELDKAMGSLFSTFMINPSQLSKIAQLAEVDPMFIEEIEQRIRNREQVRRNQSVGSLVEILLKNVLEREGFKVERTGIGSDFVIEHDLIENETEMIFRVEKANKSYSIEVKSTSRDYVRMTLTQGETATKEGERYFLCVVKLNGAEINEDVVKKNARFVVDIGERIRDKVNKVKELQEKTDETLSIGGDVEIEISENQIHFKINEQVWATGKTFDNLSHFLLKEE